MKIEPIYLKLTESHTLSKMPKTQTTTTKKSVTVTKKVTTSVVKSSAKP